jgi:hypothetical protein
VLRLWSVWHKPEWHWTSWRTFLCRASIYKTHYKVGHFVRLTSLRLRHLHCWKRLQILGSFLSCQQLIIKRFFCGSS